MGNCLSIKVDPERRVWVRKRRQRPDHVRHQKPFPSHGTSYAEAIPKPRRRQRFPKDSPPLSYSVPVTSDGHQMFQPQQSTFLQYNMPQQQAAPQIPTQQPTAQPPAQFPTQLPTTGMDPAITNGLIQNK
ncbi:hypothetical protein Q7P37_005119 [Cladosporium fusiforme]